MLSVVGGAGEVHLREEREAVVAGGRGEGWMMFGCAVWVEEGRSRVVNAVRGVVCQGGTSVGS